MQVHSEAKYKCQLCPNVYKSSHILKEHLLKHEGIRKYKCDLCNKDFAQQSHLAAHKAVHSERRYVPIFITYKQYKIIIYKGNYYFFFLHRFMCPGCQRPFNRQDNMKMHTKRCELFQANPDLKQLLTRRAKNHNKIIDKVQQATDNDKETAIVSIQASESMKINKHEIEKADEPSPVHRAITIKQNILGLEYF